ncbi:MAG: hypothetical protein J1E06_02585 [Acutalibacter sp.]|nr:hypothetical protein [Acutalibacter sp.]
MEYNIRAYVDELFQNAPRTQKAYELKVELTQNLLDKYHALIAEGKSPEDAYNLTVVSIGDVRELFEGLEDTPTRTEPVYIPVGSPERRSAIITSVAVMLYILSVVPVIVLGSIPIPGLDILGVVLMFVMIALATGLLIYHNATRPKKKAPSGTVVEDFRQWQTKSTSNKQLLKAIRSAYWPLVTAFYFLLSFGTGKWHITWIVFLIAPAVDSIIKSVLILNDKEAK